jgi:DNA repair protein RecO (recombination protein O)
VLTRHNGLVRAFVRGAKSVKNRKNSSTGMFCFSKLSLYKTKDTYIIDEAEPIELFFDLRNDLEKLSLAQYFAELVLTLVQEDESAEEYLRLILNSLHFLAKGKMPNEQVKAITELRMMCIAGFMPNLIACDRCGEYETENMYFDVEDGLLYCENCVPSDMIFQLDIGLVKALRHVAFSDFERIYSFKMEEFALPDLSYITEKYLLSKLQRNFKTLEFYKEITK